MVIVGRSEEGLQRRQRSSLDRQSRRNSQDEAAIARVTARAARSNTSSEAEAAALIRRDLLGNFTEEPLRPLWPSLEAASTAYYILPLSAVTAAATASACRREDRLQHDQQQLPLKLQLGNRKPLQAHQLLLRRRQRLHQRQQLRRRQQQSAANSNKKKKVAVNNSLTFDFFNSLAFGLCKAPKIWRKRLRKKVGPGVVLAAVPALQQAAPAYYSPLQM